jgi:serine protease inhibitor
MAPGPINAAEQLGHTFPPDGYPHNPDCITAAQSNLQPFREPLPEGSKATLVFRDYSWIDSRACEYPRAAKVDFENAGLTLEFAPETQLKDVKAKASEVVRKATEGLIPEVDGPSSPNTFFYSATGVRIEWQWAKDRFRRIPDIFSDSKGNRRQQDFFTTTGQFSFFQKHDQTILHIPIDPEISYVAMKVKGEQADIDMKDLKKCKPDQAEVMLPVIDYTGKMTYNEAAMEIQQKVRFKQDETGVQAAAATSCDVADGPGSPVSILHFNEPHYIYILRNEDGEQCVLFQGFYAGPPAVSEAEENS